MTFHECIIERAKLPDAIRMKLIRAATDDSEEEKCWQLWTVMPSLGAVPPCVVETLAARYKPINEHGWAGDWLDSLGCTIATTDSDAEGGRTFWAQSIQDEAVMQLIKWAEDQGWAFDRATAKWKAPTDGG